MADGATQAGLPSSNRGVSGGRDETRIEVGIDWFAGTADLAAILTAQGYRGDMGELLSVLNHSGENGVYVAAHVAAHFFGGTGIVSADEVKPGRFYPWRVQLSDKSGKFLGVIELGSRQEARTEGSTMRNDGTATVRIELTGDGCRQFSPAGSAHAKRWADLQAKMEACAGRITRVDVCADDLAGRYPVELAIQWREQGEFDNRGQRPKGRLFDDMGSGDGKTFYVGSATSEKQLRVYEKGREMGDKASEWVRYEAQFRASNRKELPLGLLSNPASYLLGAYPVLRFLKAVAARIDVTNAALKATWNSCRRHLKRQYGATLAFICKNTNSDAELARVVRTLASEKLPAWASNEAANQWPEIVAVTKTESIHVQLQLERFDRAVREGLHPVELAC
jgi:phage replication initiation protein